MKLIEELRQLTSQHLIHEEQYNAVVEFLKEALIKDPSLKEVLYGKFISEAVRARLKAQGVNVEIVPDGNDFYYEISGW